MAASTVAGGIFNAFAFAGASWIFSHVDRSGYTADIKRHDFAEERLQREQDEWERKNKLIYEQLQRERAEKEEATHDLAEGDKALDRYHKVLENYKKTNAEYEKSNEEKPKLDDYYKPGEKFQNYTSAVEIAMIAGVIVLASKAIF